MFTEVIKNYLEVTNKGELPNCYKALNIIHKDEC